MGKLLKQFRSVHICAHTKKVETGTGRGHFLCPTKMHNNMSTGIPPTDKALKLIMQQLGIAALSVT